MKKKKILFGMAVIAAAAVLLSGSGKGKKAQKAYDAIGTIGFSDESILTEEEKATLRDLQERSEAALKKKDVSALKTIKEEWDSFKAPLESYMGMYEDAVYSFPDSDEQELMSPDIKNMVNNYEETVEDAYRSRDEKALSTAVNEWKDFNKGLTTLLEAYTEFSDTEKSLMTEDELDDLEAYILEMEEALQYGDQEDISEAEDNWNLFVSEIMHSLEQAKEDVLQSWADDFESASSFANMFSFGAITSSTSVSGHKITFSAQYNTDEKDADIKAAMDSYLDMVSPVIESGVNELKEYVPDVCIRIEYKNKNGSVVSYREFN